MQSEIQSAIYYRYYGMVYDADRPTIMLQEFSVLARTPSGVWISGYPTRKFILNNARKRYAYPTIELAFESFIRRKKMQLILLKKQLINATILLELAQQQNINSLVAAGRYHTIQPDGGHGLVVMEGANFAITDPFSS